MNYKLDFFTQDDIDALISYIESNMNSDMPLMVWIDLFCGAGGVTEGYSQNKNNFIVACVNHDEYAIKSHHKNHPKCIHYTEDIRDWAVIRKIEKLIERIRISFPNVFVGLHASLECTHFSKAKGGLARDADSRTLANHIKKYICIKPDYITIENVEEFLSWGPVDENGKPIEKLKYIDYKKWVSELMDFQYDYSYEILNAADYGAYTSRKRYFGIFAKQGLPIVFPLPTHITKSKLKNFPGLKAHKPVREMLNLENEGNSLFGINKNGKKYVEATFSRVYFGLIKFYNQGFFTVKYNGGNDRFRNQSIDKPLGTILTNNTHGLIKPIFLTSYYGNSKDGNGVHSIDDPCNTITTKDRFALHHLQYRIGNERINKMTSEKEPFQFMQYDYSNAGKGNHSDIEKPANTITSIPKHSLVSTKWLFDTQFSRIGNSIDKPCPTIIARQDKKPIYIASTTNENHIDHSIWNEDDSFIKMLLRTFMREHGIADIKIRSLEVDELLRIQGFPDDYILEGGKTRAMKYIGNSVSPPMAKAFGKSIFEGLVQYLKAS